MTSDSNFCLHLLGFYCDILSLINLTWVASLNLIKEPSNVRINILKNHENV